MKTLTRKQRYDRCARLWRAVARRVRIGRPMTAPEYIAIEDAYQRTLVTL